MRRHLNENASLLDRDGEEAREQDRGEAETGAHKVVVHSEVSSVASQRELVSKKVGRRVTSRRRHWKRRRSTQHWTGVQI